MEDIVASVADLKFEIEMQLYNQVGVQPLPFPGMDSTVQTSFDCDKYRDRFLHVNVFKTSYIPNLRRCI